MLDNFVLEASLILVRQQLSQFLLDENLNESLNLAFGSESKGVAEIISEYLTSSFPSIEIVPEAQINNALGAFAGVNNTIYLSAEFLRANANNPAAVSKVLLEEIGHAIDWQINDRDSRGDEGEVFAAAVTGEELSPEELAAIRTEDDRATAYIDGNEVEIERATAGVNAAFDLVGLTDMRNDSRFAGIDGSGMTVAVLDTGLDRNHSLLSPNYVAGVDFVNGESNPTDRQGHGTHVAGTVGASDENIGVAPDAGLIGLKVLGDNGSGSTTDIQEGLQWVLDNRERYNIVAVNMSLGGGFYKNKSETGWATGIELVRQLEAAGITVVSAAGNSYYSFANGNPNQQSNLGAPAIFSTLAVGAVWKDADNSFVQWGSGSIDYTTDADRLTSFTQRLNADNMLFAPGAMIYSTAAGGGFEEMAGTSQASPLVAGAVALMQEAAQQFGGRLLTPAEVRDILRSTADTIVDGDDEDENVTNTGFSFQRINVFNAVSEIQRRFNDGAPTGDANGKISGAIAGPRLNGAAVNPIYGSIGIDGTATNIGNTDVDFYKFEVVSPGTVTIELTSNPNSVANFDSYLRLFNSSGTELSAADDGGAGQFSKLSTNLAVGTYYVGVSGDSNRAYNPNQSASGVAGATGNYGIEFGVSSNDPNGLTGGAVNVNLGNDLEPLFFEGNIGTDFGAPVGSSDVDLYKLIVPDDGTLLIDIDTPFSTGFVDSYLRVFDADGKQVFFEDTGDAVVSDDDFAFDFGIVTTEFQGFLTEDVFDFDNNFVGHRTDSFIGATVDKGDVYYIGVSDFDNQDYDATNLGSRPVTGTGGLYDLTVSFQNNDPNGTIKNARPFTLPFADQRGFVGKDGIVDSDELVEVGDKDVDLFKINSADAGILQVDVNSYSIADELSDVPVDTVALIFDANGTLLASNDDETKNKLDSLLQFQIEADKDYYVAITGWGNEDFDPNSSGSGSGGDTGEYYVDMEILPSSDSALLSNDRIGNSSIESIAAGQNVTANIGDDNGFAVGNTDVDLYSFKPATTGAVTIKTVTNEQYSADTFLRFFDANGVEIASNDNESINTRGSSIQVDVTANTTYYVGVNGSSPEAGSYDPFSGEGAASGNLGSYRLEVTDGQNLPTPTDSPMLDADGSGGQPTFARDALLVSAFLFYYKSDRTDYSILDRYVLDPNATRKTGNAIADYLKEEIATLDADGSGETVFARDALLLSATMFYYKPDRADYSILDKYVLDPKATRKTGNEIANYLKDKLGDDSASGASYGSVGDLGDTSSNSIGTIDNDSLMGDRGNNLIVGGAGNDILTGDLGRDTFSFSLGSGTDEITDFNAAEDLIQIDATFGFADASAVLATVTYNGSVAELGLSEGDKIILGVDRPLTVDNISIV
jgi:subtilisin family serine protease